MMAGGLWGVRRGEGIGGGDCWGGGGLSQDVDTFPGAEEAAETGSV